MPRIRKSSSTSTSTSISTSTSTQSQAIADARNETLFSDINLHAGEVSPNETVTELESIQQNVLVILGTPKKSWWWGPNKGSYTGKYLFDPIDQNTADKIRSEVINAIAENGEYRLVFLKVQVVADIPLQEYYCSITYDAPELRLRNNTFAFTLTKT